MNSPNALRRMRILFACAAVALSLFAVAGYFTVGRLMQFAQTAVSTEDKLLGLEGLASSLSRSQAALTQYVMTGTSQDRDEFEARAWQQKNAVEILGEPPQLPEQAQLERLVSLHTRMQYEAAAARGRDDMQAALAALEAIRSQHAEDNLAALLQSIRAREQRIWWQTHAAPSVSRTGYFLVAAGALLLAIVAFAAWIATRYERELREVAALLERTETMSRALAENMADGLVTMTEDLKVLDLNRAAQEMLGYSVDEVRGRPVSELSVETPGRDQFRARLAAHIASGAPFRIAGVDLTVRRSDGTLLPVQLSVNDVQHGGERRITSLLRDMTGIRRAAESVQASERHLREITDTLPTIIVEVDKHQRFCFINQACADFFGMPAEEAIGRRLPEVLGADLMAAHAPHVQTVLAGGSARYEVTVGDARGEVGTYDMHMVPRRAADTGEVIGLYAFGTNITALKRIDRMKTEFISTVSHELRTPLTSIRGSLGLMAGGIAGQLPPAAANLVGIAESNCERLIRLVNDILDVEKIESGKLPLRMQRVELEPLVRGTLAQNEGFAQQHGVQLRLEAPVSVLAVRADADRLTQVVTNLVSNAVKFSPSGAAVTVRVSATASRVRVEVADRGPGIPLDFQQRIFQKFSQADSSDTRAKGGTGLGLNISRTLVEKMGGQIGFSSTPGDGATFFFELPRDQAAAEPAATVPMVPEWVPPRATRILHVEADPGIRAVVANLAGPRATCVAAASLREARQQLAGADFDLVVLEPELADGNGWELLAEVEGREPPPPVLVFSASDEAPPAGPVLPVGVMVKSQTSETTLMQTIRRALAGALDTVPAPLET